MYTRVKTDIDLGALSVLGAMQVLEVAEHMMLDSKSEKLHNYQLSIICWSAVKENCLTRSFWNAISPSLCRM